MASVRCGRHPRRGWPRRSRRTRATGGLSEFAVDVVGVLDSVFDGESSEFVPIMVLDAGRPPTVETVVAFDSTHVFDLLVCI